MAKGLTVDLESINEALEGQNVPEVSKGSDPVESQTAVIAETETADRDEFVSSLTKSVVEQIESGFGDIKASNEAVADKEIKDL